MTVVIIDEPNAGLRLDKALANLSDASRSVLTELIREGKVTVDGQVKKAKYNNKKTLILSTFMSYPKILRLEYVGLIKFMLLKPETV